MQILSRYVIAVETSKAVGFLNSIGQMTAQADRAKEFANRGDVERICAHYRRLNPATVFGVVGRAYRIALSEAGYGSRVAA